MDMMKLRRTLMDKSYSPPYAKHTETGNPLMFATNIAKGIKVSIPSVQSGTSAKIVHCINLWDEQWENKKINQDGTVSAGSQVCSKNYIPVVPGVTYTFVQPSGLVQGVAAYYDDNYDLVEYVSAFPDSLTKSKTGMVSGPFTVPDGACYLKFQLTGGYGSTYNNNVTINYPTVDHDYHAHVGAEHTVQVPTTELQSMNGINVLQNNLDKEMTAEFLCNDPKENTLTVMTYNVQYFDGLNADTEMQSEILDEYNASVIGFQEFRRGKVKQDGENAVIQSRYWNVRVDETSLPNAIVTNYGLSNVKRHFFVNQYSTEDKGYVTGELKFKGKTVFFISTHLTTEAHNTQKYAQMEELFDLVQTKESFILVGDINTTCQNTSHNDYINMIKPFVDAGYNVANCSDQHGFIGTHTDWASSSSTFYPRDNIITSADFTMANVRRDTIKITAGETQNKTIDHVALICELS